MANLRMDSEAILVTVTYDYKYFVNAYQMSTMGGGDQIKKTFSIKLY